MPQCSVGTDMKQLYELIRTRLVFLLPVFAGNWHNDKYCFVLFGKFIEQGNWRGQTKPDPPNVFISAQAYLSKLKHLYSIASTETALEEARRGKFPPLQRMCTYLNILQIKDNHCYAISRTYAKQASENSRVLFLNCCFYFWLWCAPLCRFISVVTYQHRLHN